MTGNSGRLGEKGDRQLGQDADSKTEGRAPRTRRRPGAPRADKLQEKAEHRADAAAGRHGTGVPLIRTHGHHGRDPAYPSAGTTYPASAPASTYNVGTNKGKC